MCCTHTNNTQTNTRTHTRTFPLSHTHTQTDKQTGPGYCRPYLQLFDPGWQGPAEAGRYGKLGIGEDPIGVLDRYIFV